MSIDFPFGPTLVSVDVSMTFIATHGGGKFLPDYALSGLASPSVHGLCDRSHPSSSSGAVLMSASAPSNCASTRSFTCANRRPGPCTNGSLCIDLARKVMRLLRATTPKDDQSYEPLMP
jgi:hypothetical protein